MFKSVAVNDDCTVTWIKKVLDLSDFISDQIMW